eukprot:jgi/Psemu1/295866/fgenesh1_pm.100_\
MADTEFQCLRQRKHGILEGLRTNKPWWSQSATIVLSALLTYSYHNAGLGATNVQIAIMTVITLVGASPFCSSHLTTAAIGAFVGGQNIIGASGLDLVGGEFRFTNYLWLLLLGICVGLIWSFVITHSKVKLLDGYAGRLGTTTFLGMNAVMICLWAPLGVVEWNRYYYGFVHIIHVAEEDSSLDTSLATAWSWTEEAELAVGYVLATLWIGAVGGATRIWHHQWVQQWHRNRKDAEKALEGISEKADSSTKAPPSPLNNVLIPVLWTLFSILVVNATGYRHSPGMYNGFAVGAYVAMASLQKIPSIARFATVSLVAALWGLTLTPFFVGFAGKSGFTSMMGHVTHEILENLLERSRLRLQRQQRLQEMEERQLQQRLREEEERMERERQERQQVNEAQSNRLSEQQQQQQQQEPYHPPHKPLRQKKNELVLSTKQQRRQHQRLLQQQRQQQQHTNTQPQEQKQESAAPLQHRGWVATPAEGDGTWEWHPELKDSSSNPPQPGIV